MKTIRLIHSAAAISIVVGKEDWQPRDRGLRRGLQTKNKTCDPTAGETPCHDELGAVVSCAEPDESCPCPGAESKCDSPRFGEYCDTVCCEWDAQERCHAPDPDDPAVWDVWCADVADGGCPCPDGEVKCGVSEYDGGYSGHCATLCCGEGEQTCYDEKYDPSHCASVADGGCSCPRGREKCGGTEDWAGYCTDVCCDADYEETCYDERGEKSCSEISQGGCSRNTSYDHWKSRVASTILAKGTGGQVSYYSAIQTRRKKLLAEDAFPEWQKMAKHLESEEAALFHAIRLGDRKKLFHEDANAYSS